MKKSTSFIPPAFRQVRFGGQVPSPDNSKAMKLVEKKPPEFRAAMLLEHTDPVLRIEGITKGLGMDPVQQNSWNKFLDDQLNGGVNEVVMRKAIYQRMMNERMEPEMRKAIFQRSMNYVREKMSKSVVQVLTPDEILEKAGPFIGPKGGQWADAKHTIPWHGGNKTKQMQSKLELQRKKTAEKRQKLATTQASVAEKKKQLSAVKDKMQVLKQNAKSAEREIQNIKKRLKEKHGGVFDQYGGIGAAEANKLRAQLERFRVALGYWEAGKEPPKSELDEAVEKLSKAEARGGTYHRRVPRKNGKGFTYFYDEERYATRGDAHLSGAEARDNRIKKAVGAMLEDKTECTPQDMKDLVKKYGAKEVASVLKKQCGDGGPMEFKNGVFKARKLEKSRRDPDFRFVLGSQR